MGFVKAQRKAVKIKLAITGPSGSGKTYSALRLAFGLGERVALIDTENGSGSLYADVNRDGIGEYDTLEIQAPFTVRKYADAIREAVKEGYDVVVVDSITHAWAGAGGLLEQKDALDNRGGNQNRFANWGGITKQHEEFKAALLESPIHLIATMRSKTEYQQDDNRKVHKLGTAPIQRDGMDYEFTIVFDVDQSHSAVASKDRTNRFDQFTGKLTEQHGAQIRTWLAGGIEVAPSPPRYEQAVKGGERHERMPITGNQPRPTAPADDLQLAAPTNGSGGDFACKYDHCGKPLTRGQHDVSVRAFGHPLCPAHQKVWQQEHAA